MVLYRANHTLRRRLLSIDSRACLTLFPPLSHDLIDNAQRPFDLFLPLFVLKYSQSLFFDWQWRVVIISFKGFFNFLSTNETGVDGTWNPILISPKEQNYFKKRYKVARWENKQFCADSAKWTKGRCWWWLVDFWLFSKMNTQQAKITITANWLFFKNSNTSWLF